MDEYARAAADLKAVLRGLSTEEYLAVMDAETNDEDCRSAKSIMNHVVRSAYGYSLYVREALGMETHPRETDYGLTEPEIACAKLDAALAHTETTFAGRWDMSGKALAAVRFTVSWGVTYDSEQMIEHAIVHILRHRRQIERFFPGKWS